MRLEEQHHDVVPSRLERDGFRHLIARTMDTVIVHHHLAVDVESAAVIAPGLEHVPARLRQIDLASPTHGIGVDFGEARDLLHELSIRRVPQVIL